MSGRCAWCGQFTSPGAAPMTFCNVLGEPVTTRGPLCPSCGDDCRYLAVLNLIQERLWYSCIEPKGHEGIHQGTTPVTALEWVLFIAPCDVPECGLPSRWDAEPGPGGRLRVGGNPRGLPHPPPPATHARPTRLPTENRMNEERSDEERVAEILAEHWWESRGMSYGSFDTCSCGARTRPEPGDEDVSVRRAREFAKHQAAALAAGSTR